ARTWDTWRVGGCSWRAPVLGVAGEVFAGGEVCSGASDVYGVEEAALGAVDDDSGGDGDLRDAGGGRPHATPPNSVSCASRLAAISQYRSSASTPIARRLSALAAVRVEADPANGSSTTPSGGVTTDRSVCSSAVGFSVGWSPSRTGG